MKKLLLILWVLASSIVVSAQPIESIFLPECTEMCLVYYVDHSGSMSSAHNDVCRWTTSMNLMPVERGHVEVGLYSFGSYFTTWTEPTADREELLYATAQMCVDTVEGATYAAPGLIGLTSLFRDRQLKNPYEYQVLLIHSDYKTQDTGSLYDQIDVLLGMGVIILLTVPQSYDYRTWLGAGGESESSSDVEEMVYTDLKRRGCVSIRSDFPLFVSLMRGSFVPKRKCN